ncbi:MAG TPA: DEAD/DEAH box helicase, partial [Nitrospinota bacterium]|nr:DEAD/DEAH box helicase [Nitrospinota bacterium]
MDSFKNLGLSENTLKVLKQKGFEEPTPIQEKTIPAILKGDKDVVGQAQTGTGKTAAFGLPIIELLQERPGVVQALILTPTRELAIQVAEEINSLKGKKRLSIVPVYGGQSFDLQLRSLKKGVDIVVGTPGRILDHLRRRTLKLGKISFLVLDEADEMLNMG